MSQWQTAGVLLGGGSRGHHGGSRGMPSGSNDRGSQDVAGIGADSYSHAACSHHYASCIGGGKPYINVTWGFWVCTVIKPHQGSGSFYERVKNNEREGCIHITCIRNVPATGRSAKAST